MNESMVWNDVKHYAIFDIRKYSIEDNILTVETGLLSKNVEAIPLYKISAAPLHRSILQRMLGLCTITLHTRDISSETIALENIRYNGGTTYHTLVHEIDKVYRETLMFRRQSVYDNEYDLTSSSTEEVCATCH